MPSACTAFGLLPAALLRLTLTLAGFLWLIPAGLFWLTPAGLFWLAPAGLWAQGVATRNAAPEARPAASGKPFLARFTDIAAQAGLTTPLTNGSETSKKYILEANGTGAALIDYDGDGWLDVFTVDGSRLDGPPAAGGNRLYRNLKNGRFADVTAAAGLAKSGWGGGVCAGDYDNDGAIDLFVTYWGPNVLYRNTGQGKFENVTARTGVSGPATEWSSGCTFLDYDRDGRLDLFVTSYQKFDLKTAPLPGKASNCEWKGMPVFCGPRGLPFGAVTLYRGRPDGTFEDVTRASGVGAAQGFYAFTAVAADLNHDGWTDLFVASDSTPSLYFRNNRNGTFSEVGTEAGLAYSEHGFEQGGMGIAAGDYDGDGRIDLIKTNFAGDHPNVFRNLGKGIFEDSVIRAGLGVNPQYVAWGVALADLDNDGWQDVLQVNGHVYPDIDQRKTAEVYRNPRLVYRNLGNGRFEDVSALAGPAIAARHSSRGMAMGDIDNDGDLDAVVMNMGQPPSLLRNELPKSHWLRVALTGTRSNRAAIGAVVTVEAAGKRQTQTVLSQSSFLSQNSLHLHFGLGVVAKADQVRVVWPDGGVQEFGPQTGNQTITLTER